LVERSPMRKCSAYFLFDRQEKARCKGKCNEPHRDDWFEAILSQGLLTNFEKYECRDARDKQANTNCQRAFGKGDTTGVRRLGRRSKQGWFSE